MFERIKSIFKKPSVVVAIDTGNESEDQSMERFAGQWLGEAKGTNKLDVLLDLELDQGRLTGTVYAFDRAFELPDFRIPIVTTPVGDSIAFSQSPIQIYGNITPSTQPESSSWTPPEYVKVELTLAGDILWGFWATDVGTSGPVKLYRSMADSPSVYTSEAGEMSWSDFEKEIADRTLEPYKYIFRGQSDPRRLRTSFHRTKRKDLWKYWFGDVPRLRKDCSNETDFLFDQENAEHNGALLHLLQHHGYPTLLLDWTYSPYVAAFFAYSSAKSNVATPIRIFMFDAKQWKIGTHPQQGVTSSLPHITVVEPMVIRNRRALPQQSVATVTNLDDIETYINAVEKRREKTYLTVFDLDPGERNEVLEKLRLMGISAATMYPGLDGICREHRERNFGRDV